MRLWPLRVGRLPPGRGFDKVGGLSGTSYQVFLFLLLNPAVVLLFHGKQSEAKDSGLCPGGAQVIPPSGGAGGRWARATGSGRGGRSAGSLVPSVPPSTHREGENAACSGSSPLGPEPSQALGKDSAARQRPRAPVEEESAGSES